MSAMVASTPNPEAPLLVTAAFRQAFEAGQDIAGFLPDAINEDDLGNTSTVQASQPPVALRTHAVLKDLLSPKGGDSPKGFPEKPRYTEKATKHPGNPSPRGGSAPRFIHQPR